MVLLCHVRLAVVRVLDGGCQTLGPPVKDIQEVVDWLANWVVQGAVLQEIKVQPFHSPSGYHEVIFKGRLLVPPEQATGPKARKGSK